MVDIGEWAGLIAAGLIVGGFLGLAISRASPLWTVVGASLAVLLLIIYRTVIVGRFVEITPV